jgi:2,5-diamino-6-(ribosylamino)-4(3H)-pyrimidinone 5'-phosphate reductase
MTHFLRSRYNAILIGVTTAVVDNPSLNCRFDGVGGYGVEGLEGQPRPIVIDPNMRWNFEDEECKILKLALEGKGKAPYVLTVSNIGMKFEAKKRFLKSRGGKLVIVDRKRDVYGEVNMPWRDILETLKNEGLKSVMIEGGGGVINTMLSDSGVHELVSSVIVTITPTWLGKGGVVVSPGPRTNDNGDEIHAARLKDMRWVPLGEDVVLCGRLRKI